MRYTAHIWGDTDCPALANYGFVVDVPVSVERGRDQHEWACSLPSDGAFGRFNLYSEDGGITVVTRWLFERKEDAAKFKLVWG